MVIRANVIGFGWFSLGRHYAGFFIVPVLIFKSFHV